MTILCHRGSRLWITKEKLPLDSPGWLCYSSPQRIDSDSRYLLTVSAILPRRRNHRTRGHPHSMPHFRIRPGASCKRRWCRSPKLTLVCRSIQGVWSLLHRGQLHARLPLRASACLSTGVLRVRRTGGHASTKAGNGWCWSGTEALVFAQPGFQHHHQNSASAEVASRPRKHHTTAEHARKSGFSYHPSSGIAHTINAHRLR